MLVWRKFGDVFNVLITWFYERLWWIMLMGLIQLAGGLKIRADVFLRKEKILPADSSFSPYPWILRWLSCLPAFLLFQSCLVSPYNSISRFLIINLLIIYICPTVSTSLVELWLTYWYNNLCKMQGIRLGNNFAVVI